MTQTQTPVKEKASTTADTDIAVGPIDVMKTMWVWIVLSLLLIIPGVIIMGMSMKTYPTHSPLRLGIDFTGGTMLQYGFEKKLQQNDVLKMNQILKDAGFGSSIIQLQQADEGMTGSTQSVTTEAIQTETSDEQVAIEEKDSSVTNKEANMSVSELFEDAQKENSNLDSFDIQSVVSIRTKNLSSEQTIVLQKALKGNFGNFALLQKNRVGPTLAKELFTKAAWALILAYAVIVIYLTYRFQLDYAVIAMIALLHDTLFMLGAFSALGWFYQIEVNSMFVTAILTVVGFSVHDTIVVFDRIRENIRIHYTKKLPFKTILNLSVNQTMARSINTSLTTLVVLGALYFLGGKTTQNFVLAMILGIVIGTYSSIFIASPFLGWWRSREDKPAPSSQTQAA